MHIHVTRFMWQNGLLCAHYVDRKWVVWGLFWVNFAVVGAMKFPFCVVSVRYGPEMRYSLGCTRAFVGATPISFALQVLHSGRFALFAASRGLLCGFTWLFPGATFMCFYVSQVPVTGPTGSLTAYQRPTDQQLPLLPLLVRRANQVALIKSICR